MESTSRIFVYGTLKRGQCREKCWPLAPIEVIPAWTFGQLFDLGPYPAMLPGNDRVMGELWTYHESDLPQVLTVLDKIEGTNRPGQDNEYDRVDIWVSRLDSGQRVAAQAYLSADGKFLRRNADPVEATLIIENQPYVVWPVDATS